MSDQWNETPEGADLVNAWNEYLDKLENGIPGQIQSIKALANRPIEG